jgi:hypothetical protein
MQPKRTFMSSANATMRMLAALLVVLVVAPTRR